MRPTPKKLAAYPPEGGIPTTQRASQEVVAVKRGLDRCGAQPDNASTCPSARGSTMRPDEHTGSTPPAATRRAFLRATGLAACVGTAVPAAAPAALPTGKAEPLLPTVQLGPHRVTRLIVGGNPVYGHSHFNKLLSQHLLDWHTPERVAALLRRCEEAGINTWQNSYADRTLEDLDRYRQAGGKMHWLCLGKPDWEKYPQRIAEAAKRKPIGIAPHGALNERLHRAGRLTELTDLL